MPSVGKVNVNYPASVGLVSLHSDNLQYTEQTHSHVCAVNIN